MNNTLAGSCNWGSPKGESRPLNDTKEENTEDTKGV